MYNVNYTQQREEDQMVFGDRLKMARKMSGLSQQKLGELAGVSKMSISKYERDLSIPKSKVLLKLSDALDVRIEYLLRPIEVSFSKPEFRKYSRLTKKNEQKIIQKTHDWVERYLQVESLFNDTKIFSPAEYRFKVAKIADTEDAALYLREKWNLGLDPIDNLMEILEINGIMVWSIDDEFENFDALILWANKTIPVIVVKDGIPGDRQRYDLAHELGHLVLDIDNALDNEKVAHRFAGAFLVPKPKVYEELGRNRNNLSIKELMLLKQKYGMSIQAWIYRAGDLGIISKSKMKSYFIEIRKRNWHKNEPGVQIEPEYPIRMTQLVHRALAENVISRSRAEELLKTDLTATQLEI
jgi:Zn-dependent peptidase ImmA (M78 family)/DNA-binding XRE family transcriptional regulator